MHTTAYLITALVGAALALQVGLNSIVRVHVGSAAGAALINFVVGTVALAVALLVTRAPVPTSTELRTVERFERVEVEFPHELDQSNRADIVTRGLRVDVANHRVRGADIGTQNPNQFFVRLAFVEEFRDWYEKTFFVDRAGVGRQTGTADVEDMAGVAEKANQIGMEKNRCDNGEIMQMTARFLGVVGD